MEVARFQARVRRAGRALLDLLLPGDCGFCARPLRPPAGLGERGRDDRTERLEWRAWPGPSPGPMRPLCDACAAALPWWRIADGCPRCGMPADPGRAGSVASWGEVGRGPVACPRCLAEGSPLHRCFAAARHVGPIARLIPAFKNPRGPFGPPPERLRVVDYLVTALCERVARELGAVPDVVTSVPLHRRRLHRRGFNHADWIADRVGRAFSCSASPGLLERIRDTDSQAGRRASERRAALRGAFRARHRFAADTAPRVFLVDDVLTTGSTLEAAAEALLTAGAGEVVALTLSATVAGARRRRGGESNPRRV